MRPRAVVAVVVQPFLTAGAHGKFHMTTATPAQFTFSLRKCENCLPSAAAGRLLVGPSDRLTAGDVTAIRDHHDELVTLVKLCDDAEAM